jgi:hypothetical protein
VSLCIGSCRLVAGCLPLVRRLRLKVCGLVRNAIGTEPGHTGA